jgi:two-component system, chemotaxis family, chemotaxis protein CheY
MKTNVLVVDDSGIVRELHGFMLESAGYNVHYAINGSEAMEKALATRFEMVVTDVNMPQMDGYELTRRLRATEGYETTPILMVSTESEAKDKSKGFEAGANLYVVKPVRLNDLVAKARLLLGTPAVSNQ